MFSALCPESGRFTRSRFSRFFRDMVIFSSFSPPVEVCLSPKSFILAFVSRCVCHLPTSSYLTFKGVFVCDISGFSNWASLCCNLPVLFFALCAEAFLCWNLLVLFFALLVDFRIGRPYVEICPSCFLHSAQKCDENARFSLHFCDVMGEKSAPQATLTSSLEPLESAWSKLSNASRLELVSCCGVEIRRKDLPKFARFFTIFRDFVKRKTFINLHHGHLRHRA